MMNKIEQLIPQYCPDGVEWKTIGKVEIWCARELHTTEDMKRCPGVKSSHLLADFLPTGTIAAMNLTTERRAR